MTRKPGRQLLRPWREVIKEFVGLLQLENQKDRLRLEQLALVLEQEALAVFKLARQAEDPEWAPYKWPKIRRRHERAQILKLLGKDFTARQIDIAQLRDLHARLDRADLSDQGGILLDSVERLRLTVKLYESDLRQLRRLQERHGGRPLSVAWDYLVASQEDYGLSDKKVMRSLLPLGIKTDDERNRFLLQDSVRKHRERREKRLGRPKKSSG